MITKITKEDVLFLQDKHAKEPEVLRSLLYGHFREPENILVFAWFLFEKHILFESPQFHSDIIALFQLPGHKAVAAPRGFAKSTLVSLIYLCWLVVYEKKHFILLISDSLTQSNEFVNTLKYEIENNARLNYIYGDLRSEFWRDGEFITSSGVKVMARSVGNKVRGLKFRQYRPELLLIDDLENDESVSSILQRAKLKNWFTQAVIPALSKGGEAIMIGTILHYDSLLYNIVEQKDLFKSWNVELYKAITNDKSLWEEMWTVEELIRKRDDEDYEGYVGPRVFSQEYQNQPRDEGDAIFKLDDIAQAKVKGKNVVLLKRYIPSEWTFGVNMRTSGVDLAASDSPKADWFVEVTIAQLQDGTKMLLNIVRDHFSPGEQRECIADQYTNFEPSLIYVESNGYQVALKRDLQEFTNMPIKGYNTGKEKFDQMIGVNSLATEFENGKWILPYGNDPRTRQLIDILTDEMVKFGKGHTGDILMALWFANTAMREISKKMGTGVKINITNTKRRASLGGL